ncbi:uncharacterized protein LOC134184957 [Corticium candelabrum]|uniref:uncharacterized protein LOC134184957 n=1 Tax=Corticium candelabrum TaxID=121492 RepID=UPI002E344150|nr:uncharacterized protein LOC134184957 [Corticium candelabrum]
MIDEGVQANCEPAVRPGSKRIEGTKADELEPKRFCEQNEDDVDTDEAVGDRIKDGLSSSASPVCRSSNAKTSITDEMNADVENKLTCSAPQTTNVDRKKEERREEQQFFHKENCASVDAIQKAEDTVDEQKDNDFEKSEKSTNSNVNYENQLIQSSDENREINVDLHDTTKGVVSTAISVLTDEHLSKNDEQQSTSNEAELRADIDRVEITDSQLIMSVSEASVVAKCIPLPNDSLAETTSLIKGLINELSSLNRFILDVNKKMEGARRQRQELMRISKRRGNSTTQKKL